jgi:hypothetical protein
MVINSWRGQSGLAPCGMRNRLGSNEERIRACEVLTHFGRCQLLPGCLSAARLLGPWWLSGGGTEFPGWALVLGFPPWCCISWPSLAAMIISAEWLWEDRLRRAFILACINILPAAVWLREKVPGRFELRTGYYVWLAGVIVWAVGVGWLRWRDRAKTPSLLKANNVTDDL